MIETRSNTFKMSDMFILPTLNNQLRHLCNLAGWGGRNFHNGNGVGPAKKAGECTDYGDYNILMLEHLAATSDPPHRVDLKELIPRWLERPIGSLSALSFDHGALSPDALAMPCRCVPRRAEGVPRHMHWKLRRQA